MHGRAVARRREGGSEEKGEQRPVGGRDYRQRRLITAGRKKPVLKDWQRARWEKEDPTVSFFDILHPINPEFNASDIHPSPMAQTL